MKFDYDVLAAVSPAPRGEFLNVGIVVWKNGLPEIHADTMSSRLSAIDPNFPRLPVFKSLLSGALTSEVAPLLAPVANDIDAAKMLFDMLISPMKRVGNGELFCEPDGLDDQIDAVLSRLVRRPGIVVKPDRPRHASSKLESQLKAWFRRARVMGKNMGDLSKSRVVSQFPVSIEADVYADFAYKNGALNVIETLDLRGAEHVSSTLRNTAAFKSITLDMAGDIIGTDGKRIGVVAASDYGAVKSALRLFERNTDELYSLDSPADAQLLADKLAAGLHLDSGLLSQNLPD